MSWMRLMRWIWMPLVLCACGISGNGGTDNPDPGKGTLELRNIEVSTLADSLAIIRWNTTQQAVCSVAYGKNASVLSFNSSSALGTSHTAQLKPLDADTKYYFQITATSPLGPRAVSQSQNFTTPTSPDINDLTAPVITEVQVTGLTPTSATITWRTDDRSRGQVLYGLTSSYGSTASTPTEPLTRAHALTIEGLTDDELYHFRLQATNRANLSSYTEDANFRTASYPTVEVQPDTIEVAGNDEFTFYLTIRDVQNLAGAALVLAYDQQMVDILSVRPGDFWSDKGGFIEAQAGGAPVPGLVRYNLSWTINFQNGVAVGTRASGAGPLAVIRARLVGDRARSTLRLITQAEASGTDTPESYTRLLDHNRHGMNLNIRNAWVLKRS
ncbi:MAG: hypothetical protein U0527_16435 [Candidatus Eisenbacteria bacterium]